MSLAKLLDPAGSSSYIPSLGFQKILDISTIQSKKEEVSAERLRECLTELRARIAFYREYPDIFVDDIKGPDCKFEFRFTQRIFLRIIMRHRYVYCVFTRGKQN